MRWNLDQAVGDLRQLDAIYRVGSKDIVEVGLDTEGKTSAFVFPGAGSSLRQLESALGLSRLGEDERYLLSDVWRRIPSARYAFRLLDGGGVSLFWPIDISSVGLRQLASALHFERFGEQVADFFDAMARPSCGLAVEIRPDAGFRLRFYQMVAKRAELRGTLATLRARLGLQPEAAAELSRIAAVLDSRRPIVVNLACQLAGQPSVKLEFAGVSSELVQRLTHGERETELLREASALCRRAGYRCLNYLGVRYRSDGERSLTAYVDAHGLLEAAPRAAGGIA